MSVYPQVSAQVRQIIQIIYNCQIDCKFKINGDLHTVNQPLYSWPNKYEFLVPDDDGFVVVPYGYAIQLFCPGSFLPPFEHLQSMKAYCLGGLNFRVEKENFIVFNLKHLQCKSWPKYVARRTGSTCNGGTDLVEVGFEVEDGFLHAMDVCYDEAEEVTRYVHHKLTPYSSEYQRGIDRPKFLEGDFYENKNIDQMYTQNQQQETFRKILGEGSDQYFNISKSIFLARGHMAAKVDHIYGNQQRATFLFINAAPQWQTFNAGNWENVENSVRKWVSSKGMYVDCYTGVWGISSLPDSEGIERELYLSFDESAKGFVPVPKLYFRVVIEPATRKGIVLIGVNNPHISVEKIQEDYVICEDISDEIKWIYWTKDDLLHGYSYACEVEEFRKVVTHLPTFDVSGGLLN